MAKFMLVKSSDVYTGPRTGKVTVKDIMAAHKADVIIYVNWFHETYILKNRYGLRGLVK